MSIYKRDFDETVCIYFSIKNFQKNIMKFGKELAMSTKKNLIVNLYITKNI